MLLHREMACTWVGVPLVLMTDVPCWDAWEAAILCQISLPGGLMSRPPHWCHQTREASVNDEPSEA